MAKGYGMVCTGDGIRFTWSIACWPWTRRQRANRRRCLAQVEPPMWHKGYSRRRDARRALLKVAKELGIQLVNLDRLN